jgi:hypothetical protein
VTHVREANRGQRTVERHDDGPKAFVINGFQGLCTGEHITDAGSDANAEPRHIHAPMIGGSTTRASLIPITAAVPRR